MKKTVLGILAGAALTITMASCGPKLLTEAEVQAEITKGVEAGKPAVETEESAKCDEAFEARVTAEVENMMKAAEEAAAQPAAGK